MDFRNFDRSDKMIMQFSKVRHIAFFSLNQEYSAGAERSIVRHFTSNVDAITGIYKKLKKLRTNYIGFYVDLKLLNVMIKVIEDCRFRDSQRKLYKNARGISSRYINQKKVRDKIFARDNQTCLCCGSKEKLSIDHIKSVFNGGQDCLNNLQTLCNKCNTKKGIKTIDFRK